MKKVGIKLTSEQREKLNAFSTTGVHSVRLVKRANIILLLDTSENRKATTINEIAKQQKVSMQTVNNVKDDFLTAESIDTFLQRKQRATPPIEPKIDGEVEAKIIALACSEPPAGCARWTLRLLAQKSIELQLIDGISYVSVRSLLKKRNLSLI
jgi:transposase